MYSVSRLTHLHETSGEEHLGDLLQYRQDPAMMDGYSPLQQVPHDQNLNIAFVSRFYHQYIFYA